MANSKKILIVDDNRGVLSALRLLLRSRGYDVSRFLKICPTTPVVLITAFAEISVAVRGIKEGAADFIVKPWDNNKFIEVVEAAMKQPVSKINNPDAGSEALIWGTSEKSSRLLGLIQKAAPTDANILINGENGTGKGLIAEEIHRRSLRRNFGLTVVDVGALPESLFESELFGYAKGAFTGATASRAGKIESATGGTLFLDEIGNLPIHLQSKLLTVLQSRQVTRLGENKPVPVDIRLICATNRNLGEMVAAGQFREDLYYRINTISLTLEPLRNRPEDIEVLAKAFVAEFSEAYGKNVEIGLETIQFLQRHPWPGNIRQLRHAVENAVIMSDDRILQPSDFTLDTVSYNSGKTKPTGTLADMEKTMIAEAMTECGGNLTAVATRLGITRQTLYNKIKKMGL